jgi:hypothetical protein
MRKRKANSQTWAHIMERCAYDVWFGWIENKRPMDAPMVASLGVVNAVAALR